VHEQPAPVSTSRPALGALSAWPLRLRPGQDLRRAIEAEVSRHGAEAAFVLSGIGSLRSAHIRLAGAAEPVQLDGDLELLTLAGSVAGNGAHLHLSVADAQGMVRGGHAAYGCIVRTTAELLLALLPGWQFRRQPDAATGYDELSMRPR
jgi:uncharacterized protein